MPQYNMQCLLPSSLSTVCMGTTMDLSENKSCTCPYLECSQQALTTIHFIGEHLQTRTEGTLHLILVQCVMLQAHFSRSLPVLCLSTCYYITFTMNEKPCSCGKI